jgi:LPS export ABC transporter protein LptC
MKKSLLFVLSMALLSLLFFMIKGERGTKGDVLRKGESYIEGLRLVHRQNGNTDWTLTARRADLSDKGDKAYLSGIEMDIESKRIKVYADKGLYDMNARDISIDGRVIAKGDSYSITSEGARFDSASGLLKADGGVKIEAKRFSVQGTGMEADNTAQTVRILRNVKAIFYN